MRTSGIRGTSRPGAIAAGVVTGALALTAAACGSTTSAATPAAAAASPSHHAMPSHHPMAESARFGSDCGMIPASGMGSFHGMSMDPVLTAASHNPLLTTFAHDAKAAGLTAQLNSMHAITVFAPANSAFAALPASAMSMMHSQAELAKVLEYHVVNGHVTAAELASGMTLKTLEGDTLKAARMGAVYEVNNADITCGNIQTANATVYVINKVLIPMH
ncbi:MAG TPA: fasciclin domain-containing protein [Streptosporangiaceae bacterium]|nr:fasciclin domain-containing protein [Streptosporangiaceae bacterium]